MVRQRLLWLALLIASGLREGPRQPLGHSRCLSWRPVLMTAVGVRTLGHVQANMDSGLPNARPNPNQYGCEGLQVPRPSP